MELPASIDPSDAYIPRPKEEAGDERPPPELPRPEEACFVADAAVDCEMEDTELLSSSFPQVPGYEDSVIGDQTAVGASTEGGAREAAQPVEEASAAGAPPAPVKRKRGRPPKNPGSTAKQPAATAKRKEEEEESVCFVCLDGGTLVVCDRRGCLKAYHPACIGRDEAFFRSRSRWNCGWHLCSVCGKAASFMCYTCPYSLCKGCIRGAEFFCVRGNKGLCQSCYKLVSLLEKNGQSNGEKVEVNFDDENSWEYLFKIYWLVLKGRLSLTIKELDDAKRLWKAPGMSLHNEASSDEQYNANGYVENKQKGKISPEDVWASEELLEFVAHMRQGDKSLLTHFDVQNILLEYIKKNNLRDPRRKSQILCDARLKSLFGKDRVGHFEMLKLLELHFVVKAASEVEGDDKQVGTPETHTDVMDAEEVKGTEFCNSTDKRQKHRKRVLERIPQNVNDYAAINAHNIYLIYLRRSLMEELLDDTDAFRENVLGFFVRIKIPGAGQKQDMYRLVQIVGTQKVAENYKVGKKTTDIKLEILNLDKMESITMDTISNQDFTEEECRRLRQSIKCGFINRLTVGDVQNKARILHAVRVADCLESEKVRLIHLRDRASETGRRKELRECVEKLELLSKPEERMRRLNEVPEIHVDPHMNPNYESAEEEADEKQEEGLNEMSNKKRKNSVSPTRTGSVPGENKNGAIKASSTDWASKTSLTEGSQDNNLNWANNWETSKAHTTVTNAISSVQIGDQLALKPGELRDVASRATLSSATVISMLSRAHDSDLIWHYQDPTGKIQGPFSMLQLHKWDNTGYFPPDLRIWLTSQKQEDAILLIDALNFFQKALQQEEKPQATNFAGAVGTTENSCASGCEENNNLTPMEVRQNRSCLSENLSNPTISASSHSMGDIHRSTIQPTELGTQREALNSHSGRDTQSLPAKGELGRGMISSINTTLMGSIANKDQFFENSCPSPTPKSEVQGLSSVQTYVLDSCQMLTNASETYAVENWKRDPAPSLDINDNVLTFSNARCDAESDRLQFVSAQETENAPVPKTFSPSQEQLLASVEENLLEDYEILDGISVINLQQNQNEDQGPGFLGSSHMESSELEVAEDTKSIEWSLPSPTPASEPPSDWVISNTVPPKTETDTSQKGKNASPKCDILAEKHNATADSGWGKQSEESMTAGCGWSNSSHGDRSGANSRWGEQTHGSIQAISGQGSPNFGPKTNGDSGWEAQSQGSMNPGSWGASTLENKADANSGWGSEIPGNTNWGSATWEKEKINSGWGNRPAVSANGDSGWDTPAQKGSKNTNESWGAALVSNINRNNAGSWGNDGHREGNQFEHGFDRNPGYRARLGSGGYGGPSQRSPRGGQGQRGVCKFYESGCCKKGSSCKYFHS